MKKRISFSGSYRGFYNLYIEISKASFSTLAENRCFVLNVAYIYAT